MSSKQPLSNYDLTNGKTYRVSASVNNVSNGVPRIAIRKMDGNQIISDSDLVVDGKIEFIFTYDSSVDAYLSFFANWTTKTTADVRYSDITFSECKVYPISWQSSAGTVYGCTVKPTTGVLSVNTGSIVVDGTLINQVATASTGVQSARVAFTFPTGMGLVACDTYPIVTQVPQSGSIGARQVNSTVYLYNDAFTDLATAQALLNANNVTIIYRLATPTTYQLTPVQIQTLLGTNNFWSNGNGVVDLEYRCDTKLYIEQLTKPSEDDMTANANITSGSFFMVGNRLFLSTVAIAQGATIVPGTNCTEISLADALNSLNS